MNIYPTNFNPYMANQQPQMPWQPQAQIAQPQPQFPAQPMFQNIPCRYAQSFENITANEIPMDGNYAVFLKSDLSEIQLKKWNGNGGIENISFKPYTQDVQEEKPIDKFDALNDRITAIEGAIANRFDRLESAIVPKTTVKKKEVAANE